MRLAQTRKTLETVPDANGDRMGFMGRRYKLPDADGRLRPVPDPLADALERASGHAHESNCLLSSTCCRLCWSAAAQDVNAACARPPGWTPCCAS